MTSETTDVVNPAVAAGTNRPPLGVADHASWRRMILERCGLDFGETRTSYLSRCLWDRMRTQGFDTYDTYFRSVLHEPAPGSEWAALLELLVNRETDFFRHPPSYEALRGTVLPAVMAAREAQGSRALSLWSAGCSTGQEAYSLGICALEAVVQSAAEWQVQIVGSDISEVACEGARRGVYRTDRMRSLTPAVRDKFFECIEHGGRPAYRVCGPLRSIACFGRFNLVDPASYWVGRHDVIFCQNLLVYQPQEQRPKLVEHLGQRLNPWGFLIFAPGEVVGLRLPTLQPARLDGCLAYQRAP